VPRDRGAASATVSLLKCPSRSTVARPPDWVDCLDQEPQLRLPLRLSRLAVRCLATTRHPFCGHLHSFRQNPARAKVRPTTMFLARRARGLADPVVTERRIALVVAERRAARKSIDVSDRAISKSPYLELAWETSSRWWD